MPKSILTIIWKWNHLTGKESPITAYQSVTNEEFEVYAISEHTPFEKKEDFSLVTIKEGLKEMFEENPDAQHLILIHRNAYPLEQKHDLKQMSSKNVVFAEFGGGDDYIYYNSVTETGLIDQVGHWAHGQEFMDFNTGKEAVATLFRDGKLIDTYFEEVWRHYFHRCKINLYEHRIAMLRHLDGHVRSKREGTLEGILSGNSTEYWGEYQSVVAKVKDVYKEHISALDEIDILNQFIKQKELSNNDDNYNTLRQLNTHFVKVLNAIKEPIY